LKALSYFPPSYFVTWEEKGSLASIRSLVSRRLKELRKDYTQRGLARKAKVSVDVIGKIEREETTPSLETLHRLCQALQVPLAEFFAFEAEDEDLNQVIDRLHLYLLDKHPEHVQFADKIVREIIERLEAERE